MVKQKPSQPRRFSGCRVRLGLTLRAAQALLGSELFVSYFLRARVGNAHSCSQARLAAVSHIITEDTGIGLGEMYTVRSVFSPHAETCRARLPAEDPAPQLSGIFYSNINQKVGWKHL